MITATNAARLLITYPTRCSTSADAASALVLHLVGYVITNLAAFIAVIIYYNWTGKEEISDYAGVAERAPYLALTLSIAFFSLAGMPLFAGFATKFILFQAAAQEDLLWLSGIAVFFSFVSLYYYLVVIKQMYLGEPEEPRRFPTPWLEYGALTLLIAGVFFVGLYPQPVFDLAEQGAVAMMAASDAATTVGAPP